jgi:hypothetical protein
VMFCAVPGIAKTINMNKQIMDRPNAACGIRGSSENWYSSLSTAMAALQLSESGHAYGFPRQIQFGLRLQF